MSEKKKIVQRLNCGLQHPPIHPAELSEQSFLTSLETATFYGLMIFKGNHTFVERDEQVFFKFFLPSLLPCFCVPFCHKLHTGLWITKIGSRNEGDEGEWGKRKGKGKGERELVVS